MEEAGQLEKWVTLGKKGHSWEKGSHFYTCKKGSHLQKIVTLEKMGHT